MSSLAPLRVQGVDGFWVADPDIVKWVTWQRDVINLREALLTCPSVILESP